MQNNTSRLIVATRFRGRYVNIWIAIRRGLSENTKGLVRICKVVDRGPRRLRRRRWLPFCRPRPGGDFPLIPCKAAAPRHALAYPLHSASPLTPSTRARRACSESSAVSRRTRAAADPAPPSRTTGRGRRDMEDARHGHALYRRRPIGLPAA
jgi:hypothetical protein